MLKQVTPYQNLCCYVETRKPYGAAIYALSRMSTDKEEHVLNICKLFLHSDLSTILYWFEPQS